MTRQEAGRLGGLKTLERYGKTHMSKLGRAGFRALCRKFRGNSRSDALAYLNGKGKVAARYTFKPHPRYDQIAAEMYQEMGLNEAQDELPF